MIQPRGCCGTNQVLLTIISRRRKMVYGVCWKDSVRRLLGQSDALSAWPSGYCRGNASCRKECLLGGLSDRGANSYSKPI